MDDLRIEKWLELSYGSGGGGSDSGCGYGSGYGSSSGSGFSSGSSSGFSSGYGSGDGGGSGCGSGSGCGYGCGYGSDYRIKRDMVYSIDNTPTIIKKIKGNIAKGFIVKQDLTLEKTYIVKNENSSLFAHGTTVRGAQQSLQNKMFENLSEEERIDEFLLYYNKNNLMKDGFFFFEWHGKLTTSCKQGREIFAKNKGINLKKCMTIENFINLTKNEYGGEIIKKLENRLRGENDD